MSGSEPWRSTVLPSQNHSFKAAGDVYAVDLSPERVSAWDLQAKSVDLEQTELSHLQWSLFREQFSAFSGEVVTIRNEMQRLRLSEARLDQSVHTESAERSELVDRLEASIKAVAEGLDSLAADVKTEATARRKSGEHFTNNFSEVDARLNEISQRMRHHDEKFSRALEAEVAERRDSDVRTRAEAAELRRALAVERDRREAERTALEDEFSSLRLNMSPARGSPGGSSRVSEATTKIQEIGVHKFIEEIRLEIEREVSLRMPSGRDQELSLESAMVSLRADVANEATSRRRDLDTLERTIQLVQADLMNSLQEEIKTRIASNEKLQNSNNGILQAIEMEQQERVRGSKNTLLAIEMEVREKERIKKNLADEAAQRSTSILELQSDLDKTRHHINEQSNILRQAINGVSDVIQKNEDKTKQTLTELRAELDQCLRAQKTEDPRMQQAIRDTLERLQVLNSEAKDRAADFEGAMYAMERTEKASQEHGCVIVQLREDLDAVQHRIDAELQNESYHCLKLDASNAVDRILVLEGAFEQLQGIKKELHVTKESLHIISESHGSSAKQNRSDIQEELSRLSEKFKSEQDSRKLCEEDLQHLLHSCQEELSGERQQRSDDYTALRGGLECLDRQTTAEIALVREAVDRERQERIVADEWLERRERMGELYSSLNPNRERLDVGVSNSSMMMRSPPQTPAPRRFCDSRT